MDNKLKIVNYLGKHFGRSFTMLELSRAAGIPYATFYRALQKMKDLVNMRAVGKSKTLTLNADNAAVKSYLAISSEEEKKEFLKNQPILGKIAAELRTKDVVVLFGSYAKGTAAEKSDIDLLVINRKGEKSLSFSRYETLFGKKVNPVFVTKGEFERMLRDKDENIGKQALNYNIILNNPEGFWEAVLRG
ncbi:nucleotidyltransferase domain-containing protein [Candidatus Woesearchaeota archaeon]|nr:nucleotidyltransferase domain-containing protein [Candidatus Woesearchaeota archaeon]